MHGMERNDQSLCETSIKMVLNIIKLSSFSIARVTLGTAGTTVATKNLAPVASAVMAGNEPLLHQLSGSRRLVEPQGSSKTRSFVMQPDKGDGSLYAIREGGNNVIDGMATEYIDRVHKKNSRVIHEEKIDMDEMSSDCLRKTSKLSPYILPPPRIVK